MTPAEEVKCPQSGGKRMAVSCLPATLPACCRAPVGHETAGVHKEMVRIYETFQVITKQCLQNVSVHNKSWKQMDSTKCYFEIPKPFNIVYWAKSATYMFDRCLRANTSLIVLRVCNVIFRVHKQLAAPWGRFTMAPDFMQKKWTSIHEPQYQKCWSFHGTGWNVRE